jgi:hypothetical protein
MAGFSLHRDEGPDGRPEGIWSPYGPDPTEVEVAKGIKREGFKVRPLAPKNMQHFRKISTKKKWRNNQQIEESDDEQYNELLYDYLIEDWEGVYLDEEKTQPAPCTLENKLLMAGLSLDRANFIVLQGSLYANDDEARQEAQRASFRRSSALSTGLQRAEV